MGRKQYTDEEKAEFRARDQALAEAADAALAAPDAGERATALALRSPKLAAYSPRNLMMLAHQAEEAGIELTDIDTGRGWKERGRTIRKGTRAVLRIVYPIQQTKAHKADADADGDEGSTLFRTKAVFELSQTEEQADLVPDPDAATDAEADPSAIWRERLDREAGKLGLSVVDNATSDGTVSAELDTEAGAVTVAADDPRSPAALSALAQRLAEARTSVKADRTQARPARDRSGIDEGTVLEFD
ncbi:ArdC-like ssDNA-binding domain-containing protein [Glycomyces sp. L485]|uniref:ArdC family protein n=1 Tax=Glycomyces sp. L485 TaxID=2909235 RepID=UPI001F4BA22C|nr:ArdC family protein [Glycomyces sp. L485]MCH7229898.1 ArdC-like ssDNA-binding domain-containing protein [Glycomyces sp. L485]